MNICSHFPPQLSHLASALIVAHLSVCRKDVDIVAFPRLCLQNLLFHGEHIFQVSKTVYDLEVLRRKLNSRKKQLLLKKQEEEMAAASHTSFKFQNITEIEEDSRLLGKKGMRLKVCSAKKCEVSIDYFR